MEFMTADIAIEVNIKQLASDLKKAERLITHTVQKLAAVMITPPGVTKSFRLMSGEFRSLAKHAEHFLNTERRMLPILQKMWQWTFKVKNTTAKTTRSFKIMDGSILKITHNFKGWSLFAIDFYRRMRRNLFVMQKMAGIAKTLGTGIATGIAKGLGYGFQSIAKVFSRVLPDISVIAEKIGSIFDRGISGSFAKWKADMKWLNSSKPWTHEQLSLSKIIEQANKRRIEENQELARLMQERAQINAEDAATSLDQTDQLDRQLALVEAIGQMKADQQAKELQSLKDFNSLSRERGQGLFGEDVTMFDISGVIIVGLTKMAGVAADVFGRMTSIVTSTWNSIFKLTKLRVAGITAVVVGMYVKITQAAMDVEDEQKKLIPSAITARRAMKAMRDSVTSLTAAMGKPFLASIKEVSFAIKGLVDRIKPQMAAWAESIADKLAVARRALFAWVRYLTTDFRSGVKVALAIITEVFKGFAESLVIVMTYMGRKAGQALVTSFKEGVKSIATSAIERIKGTPSIFDLAGAAIMLDAPDRTIGGYPPEGGYPRVKREKSLTEALLAVLKKRKEKIEALMKTIPGVDAPLGGGGLLEPSTADVLASARATLAMRTSIDDQRLAAFKKITDDINRITLSSHVYQMGLLNAQAENFRILAIDEVVVAKWLSVQTLKLTDDLAQKKIDLYKKAADAAERIAKDAARKINTAQMAEADRAIRHIQSLNFQTHTERLDQMDELIEIKRGMWAEESEAMALLAEERERYARQHKEGWEAVRQSMSIWFQDAINWGKNLGDVLTRSFDRAADSFADMLMNQKADWKAFGAMFIKELLSMIMQLYIAVALKAALQGWAGLGQSIGQTGFGGTGVTTPGITEALDTGFASGGHVLETGIAKVHKGEDIIPAGGGGLIVNVIDNVGVQMTVEENPDERTLNVVLTALEGDGRMRRAVRSVAGRQ